MLCPIVHVCQKNKNNLWLWIRCACACACACARVCRLLSQVRSLSLRLASPPERHQCSILVGSLGFHGSIMVHSCHLTRWIFLAGCRNAAWPDSQWLWYAQQSVAAIIDHKAPFIVWSIVSVHGHTMVSMRHRSSGWYEKESFDLHPGGLDKPF